jgi:hypothetical protein
MKRRQLVRYAGAGLVSAIGSGWLTGRAQAQSGGVTIQSLGHMAFLISGNGMRILTNPFRSLGCTAGLAAPKVNADLVLISSQLLDEGAVDVVPGNPRLLYEAGSYEITIVKRVGSLAKTLLGGGARVVSASCIWVEPLPQLILSKRS